MARYREAGQRRVGRNAPLSLNIPAPTPSPTASSIVSSATSGISQRLLGANILLRDQPETLTAGADLYSTLTKTQKSALAQQLKKFGYVSKTNDQLKYNLETYFSDAFNNSKNFTTLMNAVQAEYIPGLDSSGPSVSQTITEYSDDVLNKLIENVYTSTIGKKPNPYELDSKRRELRKMIEEGTVTKTEKIGGKTVTRTTPGFSQERATTQLTSEIQKENAPAYQQQQSFNFMNWLSKNAAGA